jgi:hypothetical protein
LKDTLDILHTFYFILTRQYIQNEYIYFF